MKKILTLFFIICMFTSCNTQSKKIEKTKEDIISVLPLYIAQIQEDYPIKFEGDNFYFIYGLDFDKNNATDVAYRGILYSDKLKESGYTSGVEIGLTSLDINDGDLTIIAQKYLRLMMQVEIDGAVEKKAKEIFGKKTNLYNDGSTTKHMYQNIMGNKFKSLSFEEKSGYYSTVVNYFVDDLDKIDNEDTRKKTFELAKFIYDDMNYLTALQIYVRDNKFFEDYNLIYESISPPFVEMEDIKKILEKIKNKEKINESEKVKLCEVFYKGSLDYEKCHLKFFKIPFYENEHIPFKVDNVTYEMEIKNNQEVYLKWRDGEK